ncbi:MAG: efflux RND transporter permease subunit [Alphaproteobacteria bacterium]
MSLSHHCIDKPIFASVIWILVSIVGLLAYFAMPVEQYPPIVPPTVVVSASYPGASADVVADTVATPIEQEVNGVEKMLYMSSQSTNDGNMSLTITFELGTNLDTAQVLVQNRVSIAMARLPEEVRRRGVTTKKNSPDLMMVVNLFSDDGTLDQKFIGNYATLRIKDTLARLKGVGDLRVNGSSDYAMRLWLDPDKLASRDMVAGDIVNALQAQNVQVAAGTLGQQPVSSPTAFEISVQTKGRLSKAEDFETIIVKTGNNGQLVRLKDVGRVELGLDNYNTRSYLGKKPAVGILVYQLPGSNALDTAASIQKTMKALSKDFPKGLAYDTVYNPTQFVSQSIDAVYQTFVEAIVLVVLVILLFLQNWRAAVIPIVAIPLSLIGTFLVMKGLGYSINNLSLFGMILAIGIVVDDAIVVVENVERLLAKGLSPRDATRQTMDEVGTALVAMGLVLAAVFVPVTFISGISGQFFKQFAVVIAVSTMFSVLVSLTLSPALAALLLRSSHGHDHAVRAPGVLPNPFAWLCFYFNRFMGAFSQRYGKTVARVTRIGALMLVVYGVFMGVTVLGFRDVPTGFIPPQDQGYFIVAVQLPPGASMDRTDAVVQQVIDRLLKVDGIKNTVSFVGFSGATFTNATNAAAVFTPLQSFPERLGKGLTYDSILAAMRAAVGDIHDGKVVVIPPPPVRGIGSGGGFKIIIQDKGGLGLQPLLDAVGEVSRQGNASGTATSVFSFVENGTPKLYLDINRERAQQLNVPMNTIFQALGVYFGSSYINDFNFLGRTYRVTAQAESQSRMQKEDIARIRVRSTTGAMVPLGTLLTFRDETGPSRVPRYNLYPAAEIFGDTAPGHSTGEAIKTMEAIAAKTLPQGMGYEWTELAFQQKNAGNSGIIAFVMAVVFVFLLLAGLYESWVLPLSIILIVPMCLFSAISGIWLAGMDNNILTQIGLVVLIGLACKNAILIVEFAKERQDKDNEDPWTAVCEAAKMRLRPILMTAFAFILGVVPLVIAEGAGAEMRQAIGVTVFSGMLGVTLFGLVFTPVFYVLCRRMGGFLQARFMNRKAAV